MANESPICVSSKGIKANPQGRMGMKAQDDQGQQEYSRGKNVFVVKSYPKNSSLLSGS
jgi:hypothetical protein